jgi:hypothetical protein
LEISAGALGRSPNFQIIATQWSYLMRLATSANTMKPWGKHLLEVPRSSAILTHGDAFFQTAGNNSADLKKSD